jgi:hydrogenase maturation protease
MKPPVVIGYGNTLRRDDGIGRRAAELLTTEGIEVICCHQLTPELAAAIAGAPLVLFLDAAMDQAPGEVLSRKVFPRRFDLASHHLAPEQLLDLARTLNGDVPPAWLITGGMQQTDVGDRVTATGERCAVRMANVAHAILGASPSFRELRYSQ